MIKVLATGIYTSIQDRGRFGYRNLGIPLSGVMDAYAADLANYLVDNEGNMAVLECTSQGPTLLFEEDAVVAITGGNSMPLVNGKSISTNNAISIVKGSTLAIGRIFKGLRTYIAFQGGIASEVVLGSRSQYSGITPSAMLKRGQTLSIDPYALDKPISRVAMPTKIDLQGKVLEVYPGPDYQNLSVEAKQNLSEVILTIAPESNRMAVLFHSTDVFTAAEIITAPVQPGTVQLTPSGQIIILMRDGQTTGGYARILQLSEASICLLSQKRPGEEIRFNIQPLL